jgi:plastocyanin
MIDMPPSFQPVQVKIRAGDTVKWENVGNAVHHASSDPSVALKADEVSNPRGAKPFDSGFLRPGESFSQTFTIAGVYKYTCVVHEMSGMNGEVIVVK